MIRLLAVVAALVGASDACQICVPFPTESVAGRLMAADIVVLAREDQERPFHFAPVETLKGDAADVKLDLFLDSTTRRLLKAYPKRSVVLARVKGAWSRLGLADAEFLAVVRHVVKQGPQWKSYARFHYFAQLLGHKHPGIATLAHLEVGQAPYGWIKKLEVPREKILAFLAERQYFEWQALYILLLAQSDDPRDKARIVKSMHTTAKFAMTTQLAAWATAFVEVKEAEAIDFLEKQYFRNANRTPEELLAVRLALSVQGTNGHTHLRDRIVAAYKVLLATHPAMAALVVDDLFAWRRWEMAPLIEKMAATREGEAKRKLRWFAAMAARAR